MQKAMISSEQTGEAGSVGSLVTQLNMNDVLMGRGAPAIDNEGNVRFRRIVSGRRAEYFAARKRQDKDRIARQVMNAVESRGGRFLKKKADEAEQAQLPELAGGDTAWTLVDEDTVLTKVKQSLRDRNADSDETRPRRRKRVRTGNLVPGDDDDSGSDRQDQKMDSTEHATPTNPTLGNLLYLQHRPVAAGVGSAIGNAPNSYLSYESALGVTREGQLDALLRQIGQARGYAGVPITNRSETSLDASRFMTNRPGIPRPPSGGYSGENSARYNTSRFALGDLLSLRTPERLPIDPLLGTVSSVPRFLNNNNPTFQTSIGSTAGLTSNIISRQDQSERQQGTTAGTEIVFDAIRKPISLQSSLSGSRTLSVSLFEASLLFLLCDFGLPLPPSDQRRVGSTEPSAWSWDALAEQIQAQSNIGSFVSFASICNADRESVERTSVLTTSLNGTPGELGRSTVMFLTRVGQIGGAPREHHDLSLPEASTGLFLRRWAAHMDMDTEDDQPVALCSEDLRLAGVNDKCYSCITTFDTQDCHRMLSVIGAITRLRHIIDQHDEHHILEALSFHHERYKPLSPNTAWWVDGDGPRRDLWLIKSSLENGVTSVIDTDASPVGAPLRTLRQMSGHHCRARESIGKAFLLFTRSLSIQELCENQTRTHPSSAIVSTIKDLKLSGSLIFKTKWFLKTRLQHHHHRF